MAIQICSYLDLESLNQCRVTCTTWRDLIDNNRQVWANLIRQLAVKLNEESTKPMYVLPANMGDIPMEQRKLVFSTNDVKCRECYKKGYHHVVCDG